MPVSIMSDRRDLIRVCFLKRKNEEEGKEDFCSLRVKEKREYILPDIRQEEKHTVED